MELYFLVLREFSKNIFSHFFFVFKYKIINFRRSLKEYLDAVKIDDACTL